MTAPQTRFRRGGPAPLRASSTSALLLTTLALTAVAGPLAGQVAATRDRASDCDFRSFRQAESRVLGGFRTTWFGLPDVTCADGVEIRADSAVVYESTGRSEFIGGFRYGDPERLLTAVDADYFENEGRLFARGQVELRTRDGETEVRGDTLTLYEQGEGTADDQLRVSGTPAFARLLLGGEGEESDAEPDPSEDAATPYEVTALLVRFDGERAFFADGNVEVDRDSLHATAQALAFQRNSGTLRLTEEARLQSGGAEFEGNSIEMLLPEDEPTAITLEGAGRLVSEDLEVTGDEIRIALSDGEMEHLVAVRRGATAGEPAGAPPEAAPPEAAPATDQPAPDSPPARAVASDFLIVADSLDVVAPGGVLQTMYAVGAARGVSRSPPGDGGGNGDEPPEDAASPNGPAPPEDHDVPADSVGIDASILADDWIEGDTIVATFLPAPDSLAVSGGEDREYVLDQLVAIGRARTLYRAPPEEDPAAEPAPPPPRSRWSINYVLADRITLNLVEGSVEGAEAEGNVVGSYQEPIVEEAETAEQTDVAGQPEDDPEPPEVNP